MTSSAFAPPFRGKILVALALLLVGLTCLVPEVRQDRAYFDFADRGAWLGIPNFANVVTNLPFLIVGVWGLRRLGRRARAELPAAVYFAGVFLTAFGSAYFHWTPSDATLVWDRLPMTLAFGGLYAFVLGRIFGVVAGRRWTAVLAAGGIAAVLYWKFSGDLRPYGLVQFGTLAMIPVTLALYREKFRRGPGSHVRIIGAFVAYLAAKGFEYGDHAIRAASGGVLGGHPLKHLAAGGATALLAAWIFADDRERAATAPMPF